MCAVRFDMTSKRFYTTVNDRYCYLQIEQIAPKVFEFKHIFVDEAVRGQGIASEILHDALIYAQKQHIKVISRCEFVSYYLNKHPEFNCVIWQEAA